MLCFSKLMPLLRNRIRNLMKAGGKGKKKTAKSKENGFLGRLAGSDTNL